MKSALAQIIHNFAQSVFKTEDLIHLLAPSAVELKNRGVHPDQVYYTIQEKVVTLRTRDPNLGILWWIKPPEGQEIIELHVKPIYTTESYQGFAALAKLGNELDNIQTHPIGDIQHRYRFDAEGGRTIEVVVNEIVFSQDAVQVGKIGEIAIKKL